MERNDGAARLFDDARHHDYNLGRFLTPDAMGGATKLPHTFNRYSYARNNPVARVDPNGWTDIDIFVLREAQTERSTQGSYSVAGTYIRGRTLELRALGNWPDMSRIPAGSYRATRSVHNSAPVLRLQGVPGHNGILVHSGNSTGSFSGNPPSDTTGCILIAQFCTRNPDFILNPRPARNELMGYVDDILALDQANAVTTTIRLHILDETDGQSDAVNGTNASPDAQWPRLPFGSANFQTLSEQFNVLRPQ